MNRTPFRPAVALLACILGLLGAADAARAQPLEALDGARVRISSVSHGLLRAEGEVVRAGPDSLHLILAGRDEIRALAWDDLATVETLTGTRTYGARGFALGALGGAVVGAVIGAVGGGDSGGGRSCPAGRSGISAFDALAAALCNAEMSEPSASDSAITWGLGLGVVGGLVGLLVGKSHTGEAWEARPLGEETASLTPTFSGGRPGVAVRIPLGAP